MRNYFLAFSAQNPLCYKLFLLQASAMKTLKPNSPSTEAPVPILIMLSAPLLWDYTLLHYDQRGMKYSTTQCWLESSQGNTTARRERRNTLRYSLNSSSNFLPQMLLPPFPVPEGEASQHITAFADWKLRRAETQQLFNSCQVSRTITFSGNSWKNSSLWNALCRTRGYLELG